MATITAAQEKVRERLVFHLNHSPFEQFTIQFTDGSKFDIVRRFQAGIGLTKGYLVSADGSKSRNYHLDDIDSIKVMATT